MSGDSSDKSFDIAGVGRLAEAIPDEVYTRSIDLVTTTFRDLVAPITETTAGLGRYLRQKFDNMVAIEKSLAVYSLEKACLRAKIRAERLGIEVHAPSHAKTFIESVENASKETDPVLHEMWVNLIAGDLSDKQAHPHYVHILSQFTPVEAELLSSLNTLDDLLLDLSNPSNHYLGFTFDGFKTWVRHPDSDPEPWSQSCMLLCQFQLAFLRPPETGVDNQTLMYRTAKGSSLLAAASHPK